jgi:hypothetical protein
MRPFINLTDRKFGRWRVLARAETRLGKVRWLCACECGKQRTIATTGLPARSYRQVRRILSKATDELTVLDELTVFGNLTQF